MSLAALAPPTAILDANGIIGLAKGDCLSLVPRLFGRALVPERVVAEVTDPISQRHLMRALNDWLIVETSTQRALQQMATVKTEADRHVLALALDHLPCIIVTGDRAIARVAAGFGAESVDAPHVVQLLARVGLIPAAKPPLDRMIESGFGIPRTLYEEILRSLAEI